MNMNLDIKRVKISVTIPPENVEAVRKAVCEAGAGIIGNYDYCSYASKVTGTFRPNDQANPYIGENNKLEFVDEINLELICPVEKAREVVAALRQAHPYEEPSIEIVPLLDALLQESR